MKALSRSFWFCTAMGSLWLGVAAPALAQRVPYESSVTPDSGKRPLTAGFSDIDGAGGGGLVPWALRAVHSTKVTWRQVADAPLRRFGFTGFRAGQRELIESVIAGDNALGNPPMLALTAIAPSRLIEDLRAALGVKALRVQARIERETSALAGYNLL